MMRARYVIVAALVLAVSCDSDSQQAPQSDAGDLGGNSSIPADGAANAGTNAGGDSSVIDAGDNPLDASGGGPAVDASALDAETGGTRHTPDADAAGGVDAALDDPPLPVSVDAAGQTEPVASDPDDPAIWLHPSQPSSSLILATNKAPAPDGALVIFNLDGSTRQTISGLDRPNNVDVEGGFVLGGNTVSIAVLTERFQERLRVFVIDSTTLQVSDISSTTGGLDVFSGASGNEAAPMGIALYRRPSDDAIFAIVGRKAGPTEGYLWQYLLEEEGVTGLVQATKVRELGSFSGDGEIEAIVVDDELGYVYYADENTGIRKWHADPDHPDADSELALFATDGFEANREGLAIYAQPNGKGYIVATDQLPNGSRFHLFPRAGTASDPHDHTRTVKIIAGGADLTDGIEVTSAALGAQYPAGLLIAMNSGGTNYLLYDWTDIATTGIPVLPLP
jgi:3-phytase